MGKLFPSSYTSLLQFVPKGYKLHVSIPVPGEDVARQSNNTVGFEHEEPRVQIVQAKGGAARPSPDHATRQDDRTNRRLSVTFRLSMAQDTGCRATWLFKIASQMMLLCYTRVFSCASNQTDFLDPCARADI